MENCGVAQFSNSAMRPLEAPPSWRGKPMHALRLRTILANDPTFKPPLRIGDAAGRDD